MENEELLKEFYTKVEEISKQLLNLTIEATRGSLKPQEIRNIATMLEYEFYTSLDKVNEFLPEEKKHATSLKILKKNIAYFKYYTPSASKRTQNKTEENIL